MTLCGHECTWNWINENQMIFCSIVGGVAARRCALGAFESCQNSCSCANLVECFLPITTLPVNTWKCKRSIFRNWALCLILCSTFIFLVLQHSRNKRRGLEIFKIRFGFMRTWNWACCAKCGEKLPRRADQGRPNSSVRKNQRIKELSEKENDEDAVGGSTFDLETGFSQMTRNASNSKRNYARVVHVQV